MSEKFFVPVNEPLLNGNEKKYLCQCIDSGWISSEGPFVEEFEKKMSSRVGRKYGISVTNGTAALEIAVRALGISEGDEVIMPTFTIISCAYAVTRVGAIPVLVDSCIDTWNMDVSQVEKKISSKTKAIMVVHIYGLPVDMDPILDIAKRHNLKIIEDAAEMHGQTYKGKPCGCFGDISTFSFYPNKHVTTGEGGMVVTDDKMLAEKCKSLRNLCFRNDYRYYHDELSGNYRFTNLQAAVGLAQLERLDQSIKIKRDIGKKYTQRLSDISDLVLPLQKTDYAESVYWVYGIVPHNYDWGSNRDIVSRLKEEGIGARTFFWCIHEQPVYKKEGLFKEETYPVAEMLARLGFYIPSGLALKDDQLERVVSVLHKIFNSRTKGKK